MPNTGATAQQKQEFYDKYYPLVVKYTQGTGLHPEFVMAQMASESAYGTSAGAKNNNILFGIKGSGGNSVSMDTTEVVGGKEVPMKQDFRSYDSPEQSIQDYVNFIQTNPRYSAALKAKTPQEQAKAMETAGYATKKGYGDIINNVMAGNKKQFSTTANANGIPKLISNLPKEKGYEVKFLMPDGTVKTQLTDTKQDYKIIGNDLYAISKGKSTNPYVKGNEYRASVLDKNTGTFGTKVDATAVYKNELNELKNKSKDGFLTQTDYAQFKQMMTDVEKDFPDRKDVVDYIQDYGLKNVYAPHVKQELAVYQSNTEANLLSLQSKMKDPTLNPQQLEALQKQYNASSESLKTIQKNVSEKTQYLNTLQAGNHKERYEYKNPDGTISILTPEQMKKNLNPAIVGNYKADTNLQELRNDFGKYKTVVPNEKPNITTNTVAKYNGGSGSSVSASNANPYGEQIAKDDTVLPSGEIVKEYDVEALKQMKQRNQEAIDTMPTVQEQTPDAKPGTNWDNIIGNVTDAGRGIVGLVGAMEKVPEYQRGAMFTEYTDQASRYKDSGLTPEEWGQRKQMSERAYGYDVANIRGLSGGSSGVALANLGRAAEGLQDRYAMIGVEDQQVRRNNRQAFAQAAVQDEQINRKIFEDKLSQVMMNKEAGAGLVRDSLTNINERNQYDKAYGPNSQYAQYMNELIKEKNANTNALQTGQKMLVNNAKSDLQRSNDEIQRLIDKQTGHKDAVSGVD